MKCRFKWHFIWVFTVCKSMYLEDTSVQRVYILENFENASPRLNPLLLKYRKFKPDKFYCIWKSVPIFVCFRKFMVINTCSYLLSINYAPKLKRQTIIFWRIDHEKLGFSFTILGSLTLKIIFENKGGSQFSPWIIPEPLPPLFLAHLSGRLKVSYCDRTLSFVRNL